MDLILWRHAEAEAEREGLADLDRALTSKGERQAQRMGEWLNQRIAHSTRILVSPALRCQQTAQALSRSFKTMAALAPDATVEAVLKAARWPHSAEPVLVVGHQPTLGLVAAQLLADQSQSWNMKKGAVWWLRSRDRAASGVASGAVAGLLIASGANSFSAVLGITWPSAPARESAVHHVPTQRLLHSANAAFAAGFVPSRTGRSASRDCRGAAGSLNLRRRRRARGSG